MSKNSGTCQDPDKVIFHFSSYSLNVHQKWVSCKNLTFAVPQKAIELSEFLLSFEMLFREVTSLVIDYFNKGYVKRRRWDGAYSSFEQVSKISDKNCSKVEVRALNKLVEKMKTQLFKEQNKVIILLFITEVTIFQN